MPSPADLDLAALRDRLRALPRDALRAILEDAVTPTATEPTATDGSRIIRVPADGGRTLAFRLSADDLRL